MKLITVQYPDSVDISKLVKGAKVTVSDGINSLDGEILVISDVQDSVPVLVPHTHPVTTAGATGPAAV